MYTFSAESVIDLFETCITKVFWYYRISLKYLSVLLYITLRLAGVSEIVFSLILRH